MRAHVSTLHTVKVMAADVFVTHGARTSDAIVSAYFARHVLAKNQNS